MRPANARKPCGRHGRGPAGPIHQSSKEQTRTPRPARRNPGGFRALELPDKSEVNAIGHSVGGAFFRVRRLRSPLLMLTPRTGSHPRPSGPIKYVTMLVPRAQQDDLLQPHTLPLPMKLPMPLLLPMPSVVPRPPLQSCINLQSRVTYPHHPSVCLASHIYPTLVADSPQANDQKDGARARPRRTEHPILSAACPCLPLSSRASLPAQPESV